MGVYSIRTVEPRESVARPDSGWYDFRIKCKALRGRVLRITDLATNTEAVISKGYHGVWLYFYLQPGDRIKIKGYITSKGSLHGDGDVAFQEPQPTDLEKREIEADSQAGDWWLDNCQ